MRIKAIMNRRSKSGGNNNLKIILKKGLEPFLTDIEETAYPGHATEIAAHAARENMDTVVAVGGDGTVNEVLNGIIGTNVALGIIPTGTANDLATLYKIPADIDQACEVVLKHNVHSVDVISANDRCYVTAGGIGFPCQVVRTATKIKHQALMGKLLTRVLGSKLYIFAVLCTILKKARTGDALGIECNGSFLRVDPLWVIVSNQPFLGRNFLIAPGAVNSDGMFDVCLVENHKTPLQVLSIVKKVIGGKHTHLPRVQIWRGNELVLESEKALSFFGDGELLGQAQKFNIRIIPEALNLIVPEPIAGA